MGHNAAIAEFDQARLAESRSARIAEYKKRKQLYDFKTVPAAEVEEEKSKGWEFDRSLKSGIKLRRPKRHDEILENRFWSVLYLLGFEKLNVGRNFSIAVTSADGKTSTQQIDVLAADEDTVIVAECKSAEKPTKRQMQDALSKLDSNKKHIADAIKKLLGANSNRKIIWCLVSANIRWSDPDLARAKEKRIHVLTEQDLRYYSEIAKTIGSAARHQFEAEFLSGQKIPTMKDRKIPATRFRLGGRNAYAFTIPAKELLKRAFVNHRDLRDPSGAPTYQRLLSKRRIEAIAEFLKNGGYFANSIIINFHKQIRFDRVGKDDEADTRFGQLYLPETYKSCWIIDGQHRLYGAALVDAKHDDPVIPVVAFENLPAEQEASLFATINKEQRQVQKRLLDELEGELKWNSKDPEEAAKAISARALDQLSHEISGPFEDRFAPTGMSAGKNQNLTLPQIKSALLKSGLLGRRIAKDSTYFPGPLTGKTNKATLENVVEFMTAYFSGIRDANPTRWENGQAGLLSYNPGIQAHLRLAGEVVRHIEHVLKIDVFELDPDELADEILKAADPLVKFIRIASDEEFKEHFFVPFGSGGPARYFYQAALKIYESNSKFCPEGLPEHVAGADKSTREDCDKLVSWISDTLHAHVVEALHVKYGDDFFNQAIKSKDIKSKAYQKSLDDPDGQKPLETYLDILDLKKIIEAKENWPHFEKTLSIRLDEQPKNLAKYVAWFEKFNDVRKKWAHPYGRTYSEDDVALLRFVESELRSRLPA